MVLLFRGVLEVGVEGTGTLAVKNAGSLEATNLVVGAATACHGAVTVDHGVIQADDLRVGASCTGTLVAGPGAVVLPRTALLGGAGSITAGDTALITAATTLEVDGELHIAQTGKSQLASAPPRMGAPSPPGPAARSRAWGPFSATSISPAAAPLSAAAPGPAIPRAR